MAEKINFHFSKPEESTGYLLWQVTMLWQRTMKRELDKIDITHTQFVLLAALAWLSKSNEVVTQVDIAQHSKTDRMMVSKVLRTLQEKGMVTRQEDKTDTRAKSVTLTKAGEAVLQKALKIVKQSDHNFFSVLQNRIGNFNSNMRRLMSENE